LSVRGKKATSWLPCAPELVRDSSYKYGYNVRALPAAFLVK
jgi:hypothetical protein